MRLLTCLYTYFPPAAPSSARAKHDSTSTIARTKNSLTTATVFVTHFIIIIIIEYLELSYKISKKKNTL